ncbi:MAG: hypothetical protein HQ559_17855 [Lentisphaerae bacterium]|nr:hypothetical protein [Lentisphaerota bacterium]
MSPSTTRHVSGLSVSADAADLIVTNNTTLSVGIYEYGTVVVSNGATLSLQCDATGGTGSVFNVSNFVVESGATVSLDAQGYAASSGPGAGVEGAYRVGGSAARACSRSAGRSCTFSK